MSTHKRIKILHGMSDIAGQGSYSAKGLREIGEDAKMAVWSRNPFGYPADIDLKIDKKKLKKIPYYFLYGTRMLFFALKASFSYDVFHFHFGHSLLPFGLDLWWLRLLGKRVFMEFHGSDIRYYYNREMPIYYPYDSLIQVPKRAIRSNNRVLKHVDAIITHDEELRKHIPSDNLFITPLRLDLDKFATSYPSTEKRRVTIVHAPSNYVVKGSKYVIDSISELGKKHDIEFILVENKTQEEAFELYKRADIIIDQLLAQTYGVFALEAMAMGKPVISWVTDEIRSTFPEELPIVTATIDNLTKVLESLIQNAELRKELGIAGRKYVEDYHDYRKVARVQLDIYTNSIEPMDTLSSFKYTKQKEVKKQQV